LAYHAEYFEINPSANGKQAVEYFRQVMEMIKAEMKGQEEECRSPKTINLLELTDKEIGQFKRVLYSDCPQTKPMCHLLAMSQEPLRVLQTHQGSGFISYEIKIDEELENLLVLDASYLIRDLVRKYDNKITELAKSTRFKVDYRNVTLHQIKKPGGRSMMEKCFSKNPDKRVLSLEVAEIVKSIPPDEGVIIFTYKHKKRGANFPKLLRDDLEYADIDVDATVKVWERGQEVSRPRLNFLTWGQECSLNNYSWCSNIILVGILHRSHLEIGALMTGQADDLRLEINRGQVHEVVRSEVCHCFYQAVGRSYARIVKNGIAGRVNVWFIDKNNRIREKIDEARALPGAQWKVHRLKHIGKEGIAVTLAEKIMNWLDENEIKKISTQKLKKQMGLNGTPKRTFTRAVELVTQISMYQMEGRSLVLDDPFISS